MGNILDSGFKKEYLGSGKLLKRVIRKYRTDNFYKIHTGGFGGDTYSGKTNEEKREYKERMKSVTSGKNNGMFGMKGDKAKNGNRVFQYEDRDMTLLIKEFVSVQCVLEFFKIKGHTGLYKAFQNKTMYKNSYWRMEKRKEGVETNKNAIKRE